MPNIGALLKQEITRLSRREIRSQVQPARKASAHYRRDIAALKRQVVALERQVALLQRRMLDKPSASSDGSTPQRLRFDATWLKSRRTRLGLSAADYGQLVGVSPQSIYNWEQGLARPRAEQIKAIATVRDIGKRQARQRLDQLATKNTRNRKR